MKRSALSGKLIVFLWSIVLASLATALEPPSVVDDIFNSTNLLRISIEIDEAGIEVLRESSPARHSSNKPKARATVREGGRAYTNVTVQLKGFTSFRSVDALPSLTLNFSKFSPGQRFHGLSKISLNNSVQDPGRLHEKFARELFAAAQVPVPRADHAVVTLNDRLLGLYVLTEGFDRHFLARHFERTDGTLYEGGVLQDIDKAPFAEAGSESRQHQQLERLIAACRQTDLDRRFAALVAVLDMDRFLSMMAMETLLCHSDSYSMNRNNYRYYHDPLTDRITFMPHGMDRVLGTHRSSLDLDVIPPLLGMVARSVLSTAQGRRLYVERAASLFTNCFQPDRLCERVREIHQKIAGVKLPFAGSAARNQRFNDPVDPAGDLCNRLGKRAAYLELQFSNLRDLMIPVPAPVFGSNGIAKLRGWRVHPLQASDRACALTNPGGQPARLQTGHPPLRVSLRTKATLEPGNYRLRRTESPAPLSTNHTIRFTMVRSSGSRFDVTRRALDWELIDCPIKVGAGRTWEEIEFRCDIQGDSPEMTIDLEGLHLIRETD